MEVRVDRGGKERGPGGEEGWIGRERHTICTRPVVVERVERQVLCREDQSRETGHHAENAHSEDRAKSDFLV